MDFFFDPSAPWSTLAAVGRGASGEKDMSWVRTSDKLYNGKVKQAGSGHELGEGEQAQEGWIHQESRGPAQGALLVGAR